MGQWVTTNGRHVYIPDEGEENPYKAQELKSKSSYVDRDEKTKEMQIAKNKAEADTLNGKSEWKVEYSKFGGKQYKSKNVVAAKKSAEEMGGFGKNGLELKHSSSSAADDTYKLIHKESGLQVGAVVERRTGGATLYMYKPVKKK